jgi:Tol biopolymer transport system component
MAYAVQSQDESHWVVDGKPQPNYAQIGSLQFSKDGLHYAYYTTGTVAADFCAVVFDGTVSDPKIAVTCAPIFSNDGSHLAFGCRRSSDPNGKYEYFVNIDGKATSPIPEGTVGFAPMILQLTYSPDNAHLIYLLGSPAGHDQFQRHVALSRVLFDGKLDDMFGTVRNITFSPDGKRLAYVAGNKPILGSGQEYVESDEKWCVVADHKPSRWYDKVDMPQFSTDGKHVAFAAQRAGLWFLVVDGIEIEDYDLVHPVDPSSAPGEASYRFDSHGVLVFLATKDHKLYKAAYQW